MASTAERRWTYAEYLELERGSEVKHEFLDGAVVAMAGGTADHSLLGANVLVSLTNALRGTPCRVFTSDLRVRVPTSGLATYPDATVVCGPRDHHPEDANTATNPTLLVEVLSESTERYDRGEKFRHYRQLASLQTYVLVSQDSVHVEVFERQPDDSWRFVEASGLQSSVHLASLGIDLQLDDLYAGAEFLQPTDDATQDATGATGDASTS